MNLLFDNRVGILRFFTPVVSEFWPMVAMAVGGSLLASQAANRAAGQQQDSIAATTAANYLLNKQRAEEMARQTGFELTGEGMRANQARGSITAQQADTGVSGVSALRQLSNSIMQESLNKGTIVSKGETKQMEVALGNQQLYLDSVSKINALQSQKKSGVEQLMSSALAGAQMYAMTK
mgnify:CR=1 FL=1